MTEYLAVERLVIEDRKAIWKIVHIPIKCPYPSITISIMRGRDRVNRKFYETEVLWIAHYLKMNYDIKDIAKICGYPEDLLDEIIPKIETLIEKEDDKNGNNNDKRFRGGGDSSRNNNTRQRKNISR